MDASLEVTTQSNTQTETYTKALVGSQRHQVLIPTEGLVKVTLQGDRPIRIRAYLIWDSQGGQLPPPEVPEGPDTPAGLFMTDSEMRLIEPEPLRQGPSKIFKLNGFDWIQMVAEPSTLSSL